MSDVHDAEFSKEPKPKLDGLIQVTQVVYILQAISLFTGICLIIAVIVNYVKQDDVQGTWLASHFRWQIRTFWFTLLWSIVGAATLWIFFIGALIWGVASIWLIYRIIKGWLRLCEGKEMYVTQESE